ncbi:MAG: energy-coupling factor ABC transporter permease [Acidobacteriota bacterium]|nr:energy-coupling factor ABC transporter permease [Acidobacteriota bacterium]
MHMGDALVSATVGGTFWAVSGASLAGASRRLRREGDESRVPLMGVLGAFVFAVQMVNFAIPGTGSSGHLVGALMLAALLGPPAALLVMGSVLLVQALFFADGGLLAFGCNLFNMGILPIFVAFPLLYAPLARRGRPGLGALLAAGIGMELGALAVSLETVASGLTGLSFRAFLLAMLPIHLPIGLVEGVATALLLRFVARARPGILVPRPEPVGRRVLATILGAALLVAGLLSWVASRQPDGLAWATARVAPALGAAPGAALHRLAAGIQQRTALLPDYALPGPGGDLLRQRSGTSLAGLLGGAASLLLVATVGWLLARRRASPPEA